MERSAKEVLNDHLELAQQHRFEEDLERNYSENCVVLSTYGVFHGHEGLRKLARLLEQQLLGATFSYINKQIEGKVGFLEWTSVCETHEVKDGADSFVIEDGKVVAQTILYTYQPQEQ